MNQIEGGGCASGGPCQGTGQMSHGGRIITHPKSYQLQRLWELTNYPILIATHATGRPIFSPDFSPKPDNAVAFQVQWFPNGNTQDNQEYASLFVKLKTRCVTQKQIRYLACTVNILQADGTPIRSLEYEMRPLHCPAQMGETDNWGWPRFASVLEVGQWLVNNTLRLQIRITVALPDTEHHSSPEIPDWKLSLFGNLHALYQNETLVDCQLEIYQPSSTAPEVGEACAAGAVNLDSMCGSVSPSFNMQRMAVFKAHKAILAAHSPVFCATFLNEMQEKKTAVVKINDLSADAVGGMIEFCYKGVCPVYPEVQSYIELLSASEKYQISLLKLACQSELQRRLTVDSLCQLLLAADHYGADRLLEACVEFLLSYQDQVLASDSWREFRQKGYPISPDTLKAILDKLRLDTSPSGASSSMLLP